MLHFATVLSKISNTAIRMPSAIAPTSGRECITKFTNCRLVRGNALVEEDLWVSSLTGKILKGQEVFYGCHRIISPGLLDVQLNGAFGFNFSAVPEDLLTYPKALRQVNRSLISTGVTSYLPTLTSQKSEVYHKVRFIISMLGSLWLKITGFAIPWPVREQTTLRRWLRVTGSTLRRPIPQSHEKRYPHN